MSLLCLTRRAIFFDLSVNPISASCFNFNSNGVVIFSASTGLGTSSTGFSTFAGVAGEEGKETIAILGDSTGFSTFVGVAGEEGKETIGFFGDSTGFSAFGGMTGEGDTLGTSCSVLPSTIGVSCLVGCLTGSIESHCVEELLLELQP